MLYLKMTVSPLFLVLSTVTFLVWERLAPGRSLPLLRPRPDCRPAPRRPVNRSGFPETVVSESRREPGIPNTSARSGPKCREVFGGSVAASLRQDFPVAISPERSSRPSANRKRPRSMPRVFARWWCSMDPLLRCLVSTIAATTTPTISHSSVWVSNRAVWRSGFQLWGSSIGLSSKSARPGPISPRTTHRPRCCVKPPSVEPGRRRCHTDRPLRCVALSRLCPDVEAMAVVALV